MLSFIAPSFFSKGTPFISVLLVIPATTTLPSSSQSCANGNLLLGGSEKRVMRNIAVAELSKCYRDDHSQEFLLFSTFHQYHK